MYFTTIGPNVDPACTAMRSMRAVGVLESPDKPMPIGMGLRSPGADALAEQIVGDHGPRFCPLRRDRRPARPIRRPAARAARGGAGEAPGAAAANPTVADPPAAARIGLSCTTFPRGPSRYPSLPKPRRRPKASQPTRRFFIRILPFLIEGFRGDTPSCSTSCGSVRSYCTYVKK